MQITRQYKLSPRATMGANDLPDNLTAQMALLQELRSAKEPLLYKSALSSNEVKAHIVTYQCSEVMEDKTFPGRTGYVLATLRLQVLP
jgi:hypothetical protein